MHFTSDFIRAFLWSTFTGRTFSHFLNSSSNTKQDYFWFTEINYFSFFLSLNRLYFWLQWLKQNRNFRPKGEGRSGHRPLLPKRILNILVDLTLGKSYHSVVTFCMLRKLSAIRSQSRPHRNWSLIMYAHGKLDLRFSIFSLGNAEIGREIFVEWRVPGLTEICTNQRPKIPRKVVTTSFGEKCFV